MLRLVGIALIVGGVVAGFVWPSFVMRESGVELARSTVFDRSAGGWLAGWRAASMRLSPSDNPMRLAIDAAILPGQNFPPTGAGLSVTVAAGGVIVLEGEFDVTLVPSGGNDRVDRVARLVTPPFEVERQDVYTLTVRPVERVDLNFRTVELALRGDVEQPDESYRNPSLAAIGLGVALLLFAGNGGSRNRKPPPSDPPRAPQTPPKREKRKQYKWGRQ